MPSDTQRDAELDIGTRKLVEDLLEKPTSLVREELLHRARRYRYHSFKSSDPTPTMTLARHLKAAGFRELAQNTVDGKYDQQRDAIDEWEGTEEGREAARLMQDPMVADALDKLIDEAVKVPRVIVPDDGPPEPGSKGQA